MGRRISEFEPFVDARLRDGSRVNIVRSPVSRIGPLLTIRKFSYRVLQIQDLINLGSLNSAAAQFLKACVIARIDILISGGAGTGKTTFLNLTTKSVILVGMSGVFFYDLLVWALAGGDILSYFFNRGIWTPFWGIAENCIRLSSKIAKLLRIVIRGDWGTLRKRISLIGKMTRGITSSRPPAF